MANLITKSNHNQKCISERKKERKIEIEREREGGEGERENKEGEICSNN